MSDSSRLQTESAESLPPSSAPAYRCLNCGTTAPGNYCSACGQETNIQPPRIEEFIRHFFGNYISVKGTLAQTLWMLISRPGQLTVDYLAGKRRLHVLPMRLYLAVSFFVFLWLAVLASSDWMPWRHRAPTSSGDLILQVGLTEIKLSSDAKCLPTDDQSFGRDFCERINQRFQSLPAPERRATLANLSKRFVQYNGYAQFLLMPFFAFLLLFIYENRIAFVGEHMVFSVHIHTFVLMVTALSAALPYAVGKWSEVVTTIYLLIALRRVYGGRWWPTVIRLLLLLLVYGIATGIVMLLLSVGLVFAL